VAIVSWDQSHSHWTLRSGCLDARVATPRGIAAQPMNKHVMVCTRCGFEEVHDGPVWDDWFVPRICGRPNGEGVCGGTMVRLQTRDS